MNLFIHKNIHLFPIVHGSFEFTWELNRQFKQISPEIVAVELPSTLKEKVIEGVKRLPLLSVVAYEEKGELVYLLIEPIDPIIEAIRLAIENDIPIYFIDRDMESYIPHHEAFPDPYSITRIGYKRYCEKSAEIMKPLSDKKDILREATMIYHLQRLKNQGKKILFVFGLSHFPGILKEIDKEKVQPIERVKRDNVILAHLSEKSSREILSEMGFICKTFEENRKKENVTLDRLKLYHHLIDEAKLRYIKNYHEEIKPIQTEILFQFARNYAFIEGGLVPDFYKLLIASRGAVDDNFAYEVWNIGSFYPWQDKSPTLPVLELKGEDLYLNQKRFEFHRRFKSLRKRLKLIPVKQRPKERYPGEWKKYWDITQICSYPPEDLVIEATSDYMRKKAALVISEEMRHFEPFTTSFLDGLDIRETVRNWHEKRIYVYENQPLRGKVGSLVVIFDEDIHDKEGKERFPWKLTWLGEHKDESDMAFYATNPGDDIVGPGISRSLYGGFMMTYPPMRVYDIWQDSFFDIARNKPERLLLAAIDYCEEKHIAYVAKKPPSDLCIRLAAKVSKKVIYIPIGTFSSKALKKIQTFHVLSGKHVRKYAKDYIF